VLVNNNYLPTHTINNYKISPDIKTLRKMGEIDLQFVKNFEIENEFAKIQFSKPVDLTYVNFDKIAILKKKIVDIYPRCNFTKEEKPSIGLKLN